jgi:ABC-type proline/glycine betaine transport system substrate-binding protein
MKKVGVLVLLLAIAAMLATVGAGWKWGHGQVRLAGWSWDDGATSYVSVD